VHLATFCACVWPAQSQLNSGAATDTVGESSHHIVVRELSPRHGRGVPAQRPADEQINSSALFWIRKRSIYTSAYT
jgi:hypothetical protein